MNQEMIDEIGETFIKLTKEEQEFISGKSEMPLKMKDQEDLKKVQAGNNWISNLIDQKTLKPIFS
jgi:hypothetical protein|tara:strand:+ start:201 stop:395 length:195 start_codon:yes stop_codon:yes gene_type:complete